MSPDTMVKTISHELGHYLLNASDSAHTSEIWNLMKDGADTRKRDLTDTQVDAARHSDVTPEHPEGNP